MFLFFFFFLHICVNQRYYVMSQYPQTPILIHLFKNNTLRVGLEPTTSSNPKWKSHALMIHAPILMGMFVFSDKHKPPLCPGAWKEEAKLLSVFFFPSFFYWWLHLEQCWLIKNREGEGREWGGIRVEFF